MVSDYLFINIFILGGLVTKIVLYLPLAILFNIVKGADVDKA